MNIIEAIKHALEECINEKPAHASVILQSLIAQMQAAEKQEPVAWMTHHNNTSYGFTLDVATASRWKKENRFVLALHPAPTQSDSEQANQPTYGQLKLRLEKAEETIERQRQDLFELRSTLVTTTTNERKEVP